MNATYEDILKRIPKEPKWYDQNGTPRYDDFLPDDCPDIYAQQVVLLRIACQACRRIFDVEMHSSWYSPISHPKKLHYGDPPSHGCVGDSMNCEDLEVLEVWARERFDWKRYPEEEGIIE